MFNLYGRSLLDIHSLSKKEFVYLLELSKQLKNSKNMNLENRQLAGKSIALIFEKDSTRTRCAFEVAAFDLGGNVTYIGPGGSHMGKKESVKDTARVLGRFYDGIQYRGFAQKTVEDLAKYSGVPVWNGLTDEWHPTQMFADVLTMIEHSSKPLEQISFAYVGDARNNMGNSFLVTGALLGMDVCIAAPKACQPDMSVQKIAQDLAKTSGARILITEDFKSAVKGVDFIHTDVWVSMGEPDKVWEERIALLKGYQVNGEMMNLAGKNTKFMHCLPAFHNEETVVGKDIAEKFHMKNGLEVTEEVFESSSSLVFDQAENRMHTIKAILLATLGGNRR